MEFENPTGREDPPTTAGWSSDFPLFRETPPRVIRTSLENFVREFGESQERAWSDSIPRLQAGTSEVLESDPRSGSYTAILEYRLPLEARRIDALFLVSGAVLVVELKGHTHALPEHVDQVAAYARDLRAYHRECQERPVHAVLVPTRQSSPPRKIGPIWVSGPDHLATLVKTLTDDALEGPPDAARFLDEASYRPLPGLVQAARELFFSGDVREVWRARAATDPAVEAIARIAHEAARSRSRHLILVSGVPGSGKTLVGMRAVHAHYIDDLAVPRSGLRPTAPGLYLSGNGPLVEVLQYVLRGAGGGGRTFVRHIKDYLDMYVPRPARIPGEHLLVFDEAQRAFTADRVRGLHKSWPPGRAASEPRHFIDICERIPEWSVLVGLIGSGQEIHSGEEGGLIQWRHALEESADPSRWTVHVSALLEDTFAGGVIRTQWDMRLNLDTELRFHSAARLHELIQALFDEGSSSSWELHVADKVRSGEGHHDAGIKLYLTRDLGRARQYLHERYAENPDARYGLLASSRDRLLADLGVPNRFQDTKRVRLGPWYADDHDSPRSCRRLDQCVTEFGAQGLELDMALLAWGSDFIRKNGRWTDEHARKYRAGDVKVLDPLRLRLNAYRVLLTRGRDGTIVFVPPVHELDETWDHLRSHGFTEL